MAKKQLKKSLDNKIISGVLSGFANYTNIDATIIRIFYLALMAFTGFVPGVFLYILAAVILEPEKTKVNKTKR